MKSKFLKNMVHIGNIVLDRKGRPIVKLYESNGKYYILDVVLSTNFREYYAYEVPKENILNFFGNKKNSELLPNKNQVIYKVHFFDFKVLKLYRYLKNFDEHLCFNDEEFECNDEEKILNKINVELT